MRPDASTATDPPAHPLADLDAVEAELSQRSAQDIVRYALAQFGDDILLTTSFGVQAAVMLHLVSRERPGVRVVFIDTGFHFQETYRFADALEQRLDIDLRTYQPRLSPSWFVSRHGNLWETDIDRYDRMRKVEPMDRALDELAPRATFAGLRKAQTDNRAGMRHIEPATDPGTRNGTAAPPRYKVCPILRWTTKDVFQYLKAHDLPFHPLHDRGYASIGDWHSTRPIKAGEDERAGRFNGLKQECGLHLPGSDAEAASRASSDL